MSIKLTTLRVAIPALIIGAANQAIASPLPVSPGPMLFQGDVDAVTNPGGLAQQNVTGLGTFTASPSAFGNATATLVGGIDPSLSAELDVSSSGTPTGGSANGNPIVFQYQFVVHGAPGAVTIGFGTDGQISSGALGSDSGANGSGTINWSVTGVGFTTITDMLTCASGPGSAACSNSFHDAGSALFNVDQIYTVSLGAQFHAFMFPVVAESLTVKGNIDPLFTAPDGYSIEYSAGLLEGGPTSATPLPAALPMFAGGAGLIGLLARRRKQKRAA
jgi:hypothetical protein